MTEHDRPWEQDERRQPSDPAADPEEWTFNMDEGTAEIVYSPEGNDERTALCQDDWATREWFYKAVTSAHNTSLLRIRDQQAAKVREALVEFGKAWALEHIDVEAEVEEFMRARYSDGEG